MNLREALNKIEDYLGLWQRLSLYVAQDNIGGYHPDPTQRKWPAGAVWENEGKVLYALTRALQFKACVEIGIQDGCSASHIALALKNQVEDAIRAGITPPEPGHLDSIDRANSGTLIENDLRQWISIIGGDAEVYIPNHYADGSLDFIFEDGEHSEALGYTIAELAKTKLRPGGILIAHDVEHPIVGKDVRAGYDKAGLDYITVLIEPADTGLLIWKNQSMEV